MIETEKLIQDLQVVRDKLKHPPTMSEYSQHGKYSGNTCERRFGSWNKALLKSIGCIKRKSPTTKITHPCEFCEKPTMNSKYCSKNCAASFNNTLPRSRMKPKQRFCVLCNKSLRKDYANPCLECSTKQKIEKFGEKMVSDFSSTYARHRYQKIRHHAHRVAKFHGLEKKCNTCGHDKHVQLCHSMSIASFSKNTKLSTVNNIDNLVYLCPNHHWELDAGMLEY